MIQGQKWTTQPYKRVCLTEFCANFIFDSWRFCHHEAFHLSDFSLLQTSFFRQVCNVSHPLRCRTASCKDSFQFTFLKLHLQAWPNLITLKKNNTGDANFIMIIMATWHRRRKVKVAVLYSLGLWGSVTRALCRADATDFSRKTSSGRKCRTNQEYRRVSLAIKWKNQTIRKSSQCRTCTAD